MIALFYVVQPQLSYTPAALTVVVGLYPVGLLCMMTYYLIFHPSKTAEWYWIGIPRRCDCLCLRRKPESEPELDTVCEQRQNVVISSPRLVSMNGGVPNLPGIHTTPQSTVETTTAGMESEHRQNGPGKTMAIVVSPTSTGTLVDGDSVHIQYDTHINLPDESIPYHVESRSISTGIHSQSTDIVVGVKGQTDTEEEMHRNDNLLESPPTSNLSQTNHLSPERKREGVESSPFRHIPAKQTDYLTQKGQLEQHYFPEPRNMTRKWSQPAQSTSQAPWQRFGSTPGYTSNLPPSRRLQDRASTSYLPHTSPHHHSPLHRNIRQGAPNQSPMRTRFSRPELSPERNRRKEELLQPHFSPERLGMTQLSNAGNSSSRVIARRPERWSAWMVEGERGARDVNLHEPSLDRSRDSLLAQRRSLERGKEELRQLYGVNLDQQTRTDASLERQKKFYWLETVPTALPPDTPPTEAKFSNVSPERGGVPPNRQSTPRISRFEEPTAPRQRAYSEGEAMVAVQTQQQKLRPRSYLLDSGEASSNLPTAGPQRGANIANRSPERYFKFPPPVQRPRFPSHVALHNPRTWARPNGGLGPRHSVHTNPLQADPLPWSMYRGPRQMRHGTRTMGGRAHTLLHIPSVNSRTTQV